MRVATRAGVLLALWLLAWGEVSAANVASGVAAAVVLLLAFPPGPRSPGRSRFSALGVARLVGYVIMQLVVSNLTMTRHTLRRRPSFGGGVLAHHLQEPSEHVVTLMTSIIALSPGTMTVDVDDRSETVYVHFLDLPDIGAGRAGLDRLERLCVAAVSAGGPSPSSDQEVP